MDEKTDNRATSRYACGGVARIAAPGVLQSQAGRILNLSLGGCLVELQKGGVSFREGGPIELTIQSHGSVFRVRGTVTKRPEKMLIGIAFRAMSPRSEAELEEVIEMLTTTSASAEADATTT